MNFPFMLLCLQKLRMRVTGWRNVNAVWLKPVLVEVYLLRPTVVATLAFIQPCIPTTSRACEQFYATTLRIWVLINFRRGLQDRETRRCRDDANSNSLDQLRWCQGYIRNYARSKRSSKLVALSPNTNWTRGLWVWTWICLALNGNDRFRYSVNLDYNRY